MYMHLYWLPHWTFQTRICSSKLKVCGHNEILPYKTLPCLRCCFACSFFSISPLKWWASFSLAKLRAALNFCGKKIVASRDNWAVKFDILCQNKVPWSYFRHNNIRYSNYSKSVGMCVIVIKIWALYFIRLSPVCLIIFLMFQICCVLFICLKGEFHRLRKAQCWEKKCTGNSGLQLILQQP